MLFLRQSKIHGVGVFTDSLIKSGEVVELFGDPDDTVRVARPPIGLEEYCVKQGDYYLCPADPKRMSIGWYLNHSVNSNLAFTGDYVYFADGDIQCGEELTVNYDLLDK